MLVHGELYLSREESRKNRPESSDHPRADSVIETRS